MTVSIPLEGSSEVMLVDDDTAHLFLDPNVIVSWPPSLRDRPPRVTNKKTRKVDSASRLALGITDPQTRIIYGEGGVLDNRRSNMTAVSRSAYAQHIAKKKPSRGTGKPRPRKQKQPIPQQVTINTSQNLSPEEVQAASLQAIDQFRDYARENVPPPPSYPWEYTPTPLSVLEAPAQPCLWHYNARLKRLFNLDDLSMAEFHDRGITLIMKTAIINGSGKDTRRFETTIEGDGHEAVETLKQKLLSLDTTQDVSPRVAELQARIDQLEGELETVTAIAESYLTDKVASDAQGQKLADRMLKLMERLSAIPYIDLKALTDNL